MQTQLDYAYAAYTESIQAMLTTLAAHLKARDQDVQRRGITQADVDEMHRIMMAIPEMEEGDTPMALRTRPNDKALDAYIAAQAQALCLLDALRAQLDAHQDALAPEEIHWGHVGDITSLVALLTSAHAEMGGEA